MINLEDKFNKNSISKEAKTDQFKSEQFFPKAKDYLGFMKKVL